MKRGVLIGLLFLVFLPSVFAATSGLANLTVSTENEAPTWSTISNQTWAKNSVRTLLLTNYSSDRENYTLIYSSTTPVNISVSIESNGNVSLTPDVNFTGNRSIIFYAFDYINIVSSSLVYLEVNTTIIEATTPEPSSSTTLVGTGGGTRTIYIINETEEEEEELVFFAPSFEIGCFEEEYYFEELALNNLLEIELSYCNKIVLDVLDSGEKVHLFLKDIEKDKAVFLFYKGEGQIEYIILDEEESIFLDQNNDHINDYFLSIILIDKDQVTVQISKLEQERIFVLAPGKKISLLFLIGLFLIIVSLLLVLFIFLRRINR